MKFSDSTSCYYDNVVIQQVIDPIPFAHTIWKVHRFRHPAEYYRTKREAYQAAIQLMFEAQLENEGETFERDMQAEIEPLQKTG